MKDNSKLTYGQLKEYLYDDSLDKMLTDSQKTTLSKSLNDWFGGTTFDEVKRITSIDPLDYPEAIDIEDSSKETDRDEALELAKCEWRAKSLSERFEHFIELCDSASEL